LRTKYIAINAAVLVKPDKTGVEWYAWQLLKYLAREWKDTDPMVVLFAPGNGQKIPDFKKKNWRIKHLPGKYLWTQHHLRKFLKRYPPALLLSPSYVSPRFLPKSIPAVNVVHGLEGEHYPEFRSIKDTVTDYLINIPALRKSAAIIAVSKHTKTDLNYFYGIPPDLTRVVLSGRGTIDDDFAHTDEKKNKQNIQFFLLAGPGDRKNLPLALEIFFRLRELSPKEITLAIAGTIKDKKLRELIKTDRNISYLGYVDEKTKIELLESSHFLLYSSLYEGFGFPVLEAQTCGAIPIVLEGSGLKEVGGNAIVEFNPLSKRKSLRKIVELIKEPEKYRQKQKIGLKNSQRFSWQSSARETKKILLQKII